MKSRNLFLFAATAAISITLTACGGGNDSKTPTAEQAAQQAPAGGGQTLPEGHPQVPQFPGGGAPAGGGQALPEGHPQVPGAGGTPVGTVQHASLKSSRRVALSAEVKKRWTAAKLSVKDATTGKSVVKEIGVGKKVSLEGDASLGLTAFVPDYAISGDEIISRSNDPKNPAVLVELSKGGKVVSSGWVFQNLKDFNSYSNERYALELLPSK